MAPAARLSGVIGGVIPQGRAAGLLVTAPSLSPLAAILIDFFQVGWRSRPKSAERQRSSSILVTKLQLRARIAPYTGL